MAKPLNDFMVAQIGEGHVNEQDARRWMFPAGADESAILSEFLGNYPAVMGNTRIVPHKSRHIYRINKFNAMVSPLASVSSPCMA
jgi:hypothetical protein